MQTPLPAVYCAFDATQQLHCCLRSIRSEAEPNAEHINFGPQGIQPIQQHFEPRLPFTQQCAHVYLVGLVDRLPVRGAFVAFLCVCTSVPALSW